MAIVKGNYVKRGRGERARAKATIRYMQHRPGKDGARVTRKLFGPDGVLEREHAYRMIDEAKQGTVFFRIVISPDPKREDTRHDLDLWEITTKTMQTLEERLKKQVQWVAAEHNDHVPHRHIHAVVLVRGRLTAKDFQALRQTATEAALFQRKERDLARGHEPERLTRLHVFKAHGAGRVGGSTRPARPSQTCPLCGPWQIMERLSRDRYRCPSCGGERSPNRSAGVALEEAQWER